MCFANVAFMGFPVAEAILGRESLFMVSIYNIPFQFLAFSIGIFMIAGPASINPAGRSRKAGILAMLLNPAIVSTIAGFLLFMFSVKIPAPFSVAATLLGSITTPLSMVLIGSVLAGTRMMSVVGNPRLWTTTLYRLALHPLMVMIAVKSAGLAGMELYVPVLMAGMPVAANATILSGVYGGDVELASALVFITTLASLVTIPLLYRILA
jgi:malate permease and related proteins